MSRIVGSLQPGCRGRDDTSPCAHHRHGIGHRRAVRSQSSRTGRSAHRHRPPRPSRPLAGGSPRPRLQLDRSRPMQPVMSNDPRPNRPTLDDDTLERIDAYWRAANYLSVGQIYLLDNPLLREPLRLEHIKPRLLGHWGTTPGLNFIYVHLNRVITAARPRHDLHRRARATAGPGWSPTRISKAPTARSIPTSRRMKRACAAVPAVLVPRRHPEPRRARDAGLDPRRRRARLRAVARLRRGVRQPGPDRRLRRRRRRGRDRPAGHELALQQVPRPGAATARCCRSCTSTATRSPTRRCWRGFPRRS